MSLDDPEHVRHEYETDAALAARQSVYSEREGDDTFAMILDAIREPSPRRVLEVGGGQGTLAERIVGELDVELVGVDQSAHMVELQRVLGLDARVGDVQDLPFEDGAFDCAVAAWMLYHVPDLTRGLTELARVLAPGGRLVAVTNGLDHLNELWSHLRRDLSDRERLFMRENGERLLAPHFACVERRDSFGWITMDEDAVRRYAENSFMLLGGSESPKLETPLRVRTVNTVFVCDKS